MHVPVDTPEEGYKITCVLAYYDRFLLENNVRGDYCNTGGLQYFDTEDNEWCDWYFEDEINYYDDLDEYIESTHPKLLDFMDTAMLKNMF